jgi:hypothetical protein
MVRINYQGFLFDLFAEPVIYMSTVISLNLSLVDRSYEKRRSNTKSQGGKEHPTYNKKEEP